MTGPSERTRNHSQLGTALKTQGLDQGVALTLRTAGLKATSQRIAIALCLMNDESHPTAQEIFDRLRPGHPAMSFATVYNTLAALTAIGHCRKLVVGGATRFDPKTTVHHHAVCDRCGAVRDVAAGAETTPRALPGGFAVTRVERIYRGLCSACQKARRSKSKD